MLKRLSICTVFVLGFVLLLTAGPANAQLGNAGSIEGVVRDSSGGVVAGAKVEISYAVSGYQREMTTGSDGSFHFTNVPFNTYHLVVTTPGFASYTQDVDVRSSVPTSVQISLKIGTAATSVTVEGKWWRPGRERPQFSYGRGHQLDRKDATGEPIVFGEFAGDAGDAGRGGRTRTACFTDSVTTPRIRSR